MSTPVTTAHAPGAGPPARPVLVVLSLLALYFVWGSTYLVLRFMVEELPPMIGNGIRFTVAGIALGGILAIRGHRLPTRKQWRSAAVVGLLLLVGGVGVVTIALENGVGSALAATAIAVMPLWAALWSGLFGRWPSRYEWAGMVLGVIGVVVLFGEGDFAGNPLGFALVLAAPISWALGSILTSRIQLASGAMATASYMLAGGALLVLIGLARGERITEMPALTGWLALAYLTVLGSMLTLTAYTYALRHLRPALATSYAYVNPIVAVILGVTVGSEVLSGEALIALPIILTAVALVALGRRRTRSPVTSLPARRGSTRRPRTARSSAA